MLPVRVRESNGDLVVERRLGAGGFAVRVLFVLATGYVVAMDLAAIGVRPLVPIVAESLLLVVLGIAVAGLGLYRVRIDRASATARAWRFPRLPRTVPLDRVHLADTRHGGRVLVVDRRAYFLHRAPN